MIITQVYIRKMVIVCATVVNTNDDWRISTVTCPKTMLYEIRKMIWKY